MHLKSNKNRKYGVTNNFKKRAEKEYFPSSLKKDHQKVIRRLTILDEFLMYELMITFTKVL